MVTKKQIAKEIGKDTVRGLVNAGESTCKGLAQIACKLSYPILGNLSGQIQDKIERKLGKEYYNTEDAYKTTLVTNYITRISAGAYLGCLYTNNSHIISSSLLSVEGQKNFNAILGIIACGGIGWIYTLFENSFRKEIVEKNEKNVSGNYSCPSLVGKLISLPFEGIFYIHERIQDYLENVKAEIESREKRSSAKNLENKAEGGRE